MSTLNRTANNNDTPFHQHSLYRLASRHLAQGQTDEAIQQLQLLAEIYPEEAGLRDMLMRAQMQATLVEDEIPVVQRREASPFLRRLLTLLLVMTVGLMVIAGFYYLYDRFVLQVRAQAEEEQRISSLRLDCQVKMDKGDWEAALACCQELLGTVPGDAYCQAALPTIDVSQRLGDTYVAARAAEEQCYATWEPSQCQTALDLYRQLHAQAPSFRDVAQRIVDLEELSALEARWQEAQPCIQGQDWPCVIDKLTAIYKQDQSFRDPYVKDTLIRGNVELARQRIAQAGCDIGALRVAIDLLDEAFRLGLTDPNLRRERELLNNLARGAEAFQKGDREQALVYWWRVYRTDPNYQVCQVPDRLREITPEVARELIAQAAGDVAQLTLAIDYLNLAIELMPDAQDLVVERDLAQAFVNGEQAYSLEEPDYCGAMTFWGEIYRVQPDYQNGALQDRLRLTCERCKFPDQEVCTP